MVTGQNHTLLDSHHALIESLVALVQTQTSYNRKTLVHWGDRLIFCTNVRNITQLESEPQVRLIEEKKSWACLKHQWQQRMPQWHSWSHLQNWTLKLWLQWMFWSAELQRSPPVFMYRILVFLKTQRQGQQLDLTFNATTLLGSTSYIFFVLEPRRTCHLSSAKHFHIPSITTSAGTTSALLCQISTDHSQELPRQAHSWVCYELGEHVLEFQEKPGNAGTFTNTLQSTKGSSRET